MGETVSVKNGSGAKGNRLEVLQARFDALESGARERLLRALGAGQHKLGELDEALARMTREDWTAEGMRKRLDGIRARAESMRDHALKRVADMPGTAMTALANGSRAQVQGLSRELSRLAKLIEPPPSKSEAPEAVTPVPEKPARAAKQKVEV